MSTDPTIAQQHGNQELTQHECRGLRHLHAAGYSIDYLAFGLERDRKSIRAHINGRCRHGTEDMI